MFEENVVRIEGGLGSQLLSMMIFMVRRQSNPQVILDSSYFYPTIDTPEHRHGSPTRWPWELHRYGISLDSFPNVENSSLGALTSRIVRRVNGVFGHQEATYYEDEAKVNFSALMKARSTNWQDTFPIVTETWELTRDLALGDEDSLLPFCAIHIRQGDYLKVASQLYPAASVADLLSKISPLVPPQVVVFSDSEISEPDRDLVASQIKGSSIRWAIEAIDQHAVHGVQRLADVLITSNSTFSASASLLSAQSKQLVFMPTWFYSKKDVFLNRVFQGLSEWQVMSTV